MRSLCAVFGTALFALTMAACVAEDPPTSSDDPVDDAVAPVEAAPPAAGASDEVAQIITVPPQMSFTRPDQAIEANHSTNSGNACHVTLLSCADPRLSTCMPSFYQNGACSFDQAVCAAYWLCVSACGASHCNVLAQFPDSGSC